MKQFAVVDDMKPAEQLERSDYSHQVGVIVLDLKLYPIRFVYCVDSVQEVFQPHTHLLDDVLDVLAQPVEYWA